MARPRNDLTGKSFNHLTAVKFSRMHKAQSFWIFRCSCGELKEVRSSHAISGQIKSCGCSTSEMMAAAKTRHGYWAGGAGSPEHSAWTLAKTRCHQPNNQAFKDYGARGITMCSRWRSGEGRKSGFECFIADMGDRPSPQHSLDRIDNSKGYEPENCRWATKSQQQRNTRSNRIVVFNGQEMCVAEAIEAAGSVIEIDRVVKRLNAGWAVDEAVSTPSLKRGGRR